MKKVLMGLIATLLVSLIPSTSHANDQKVIAILDHAITSDYSSNVIYEVCIVANISCPNNSGFMEGIGSAQISGDDLKIKNIGHGQEVVSVAMQNDPNIKIVFIRISSINRYPTFSALHTDGNMIAKALDWISNNYSKYSIDAVSISMARINFAKGTCPTDKPLESEIQELKAVNIPVFIATGNWARNDHTAFPACVTDAIGVSGLNNNDGSFFWTHHGVGVDYYTTGNFLVNSPTIKNRWITGSSVSTPALAVKWVNTFSGSYSEQIEQANRIAVRKIDKNSKSEMKIIR